MSVRTRASRAIQRRPRVGTRAQKSLAWAVGRRRRHQVSFRVCEQARPRIGVGRRTGAVDVAHGGGVLDECGDGGGVAGAFANAPAVLGLGEARQDERAASFEGGLQGNKERASGGRGVEGGRRSRRRRLRWRANTSRRTRRPATRSGCAESARVRRRSVDVGFAGAVGRWICRTAALVRQS